MNGIAKVQNERGVVWKIRYRAPVAPGSRTTRQVIESLKHCDGKGAAQGVLASRLAAIFNGTYRARSITRPITLSEAVENFLTARKGELRAWRNYAGSLRNHVARLLGKKYMQEVTTGLCEDYRRTRREEKASEATIRNELRYLQSVFLHARKNRQAEHDPIADVSFKGLDNARTRVPTDAEIRALAAAALSEPPHSYMRPLFFVLVCTGLRLQSALTLRWEHIDIDARELAAIQKGGRTVRPPMSQLLAAELERWKPTSLAFGKGSGWVFPSTAHKGKHLSPSGVQNDWPGFLARAGVTGIIRHDLRRYVVTKLRDMGLDNKGIGAVSGQSTSAMIDRYDRGAHARAAAMIDRVVDLKSISDGATKQ